MGFSLRGLTRAAVGGTAGYMRGQEAGRQQKDKERDDDRKLKLEESREARDTRLDALRESLIGAQTEEAKSQSRYYESGATLRDKTDPNKPRTSRSPATNAALMKDENYRRQGGRNVRHGCGELCSRSGGAGADP
jgi:hypothetical protein